jgi:hypothetical protein
MPVHGVKDEFLYCGGPQIAGKVGPPDFVMRWPFHAFRLMAYGSCLADVVQITGDTATLLYIIVKPGARRHPACNNRYRLQVVHQLFCLHVFPFFIV